MKVKCPFPGCKASYINEKALLENHLSKGHTKCEVLGCGQWHQGIGQHIAGLARRGDEAHAREALYRLRLRREEEARDLDLREQLVRLSTAASAIFDVDGPRRSRALQRLRAVLDVGARPLGPEA